MRGARIDDLTREYHLHRFPFTNQTRQSLRATTTGNDPEIDLRLTKRRRLTRNTNVARQRQLTTATKTKAVNHRNHRLRKPIDCGEQGSSHHHVALCDRRATGKLRNVCPSDESFVTSTGKNDNTNRAIVAKLF